MAVEIVFLNRVTLNRIAFWKIVFIMTLGLYSPHLSRSLLSILKALFVFYDIVRSVCFVCWKVVFFILFFFFSEAVQSEQEARRNVKTMSLFKATLPNFFRIKLQIQITWLLLIFSKCTSRLVNSNIAHTRNLCLDTPP